MRRSVFVCLVVSAMIFPNSCSNPNVTGRPEEVLSKKVYSSVITSYEQIYDFHEGVAIVKSNGKDGAIGTKGKEIIPCSYDDLYHCSDGMIRFREKGENYSNKYGYLNVKGEVIVPAIYDKAEPFSDGLALVGKDEGSWDYKYGYINTKGEVIVPIKFERAKTYSEGLAQVYIEARDGWGYINTKGEVAIPGPYDSCERFSEGLACVTKGDKSMAIDKDGQVVITLGSEGMFADDAFSEGLIPVIGERNGKIKFAYIDKSGAEVLPYQYEYAEGFDEGKAYAIQDKKIVLINKKGEVLEETKDYEVLNPLTYLAEGLIMAALGVDLDEDYEEDDEDDDDDLW